MSRVEPWHGDAVEGCVIAFVSSARKHDKQTITHVDVLAVVGGLLDVLVEGDPGVRLQMAKAMYQAAEEMIDGADHTSAAD